MLDFLHDSLTLPSLLSELLLQYLLDISNLLFPSLFFPLFSLCSFGGLLSSSQTNHTWRLILHYECLPLALLFFLNQIFLIKLFYLAFPLGFFLFILLYILPFLLLQCLLCSWVACPWYPPLSLAPPSFSRFLLQFRLSACQPHLSLLLPHYWSLISLVEI